MTLLPFLDAPPLSFVKQLPSACAPTMVSVSEASPEGMEGVDCLIAATQMLQSRPLSWDNDFLAQSAAASATAPSSAKAPQLLPEKAPRAPTSGGTDGRNCGSGDDDGAGSSAPAETRENVAGVSPDCTPFALFPSSNGATSSSPRTDAPQLLSKKADSAAALNNKDDSSSGGAAEPSKPAALSPS